ncbi:unnamed protein product [Prunus brigantina]
MLSDPSAALSVGVFTWALYEEVIPTFNVKGKKSFYLGQVRNGAKMKLVVNMIMGRFPFTPSKDDGPTGDTDLGKEKLKTHMWKWFGRVSASWSTIET